MSTGLFSTRLETHIHVREMLQYNNYGIYSLAAIIIIIAQFFHYSAVTFRGMNNATFRGFFVRCRVVADGSYVGEFAVLANEPLTRLSSCTPAEVHKFAK